MPSPTGPSPLPDSANPLADSSAPTNRDSALPPSAAHDPAAHDPAALDPSLDADPDVDMVQPIPTGHPSSSSTAAAAAMATSSADLLNAAPGAGGSTLPNTQTQPFTSSSSTLDPTGGAGGAADLGGLDGVGPDGVPLRQEALDLGAEEARLPPARKDVSLREFLSKMDDYAPVIPDAVTFHALTMAGLPPPPLSHSGATAPAADGVNGTAAHAPNGTAATTSGTAPPANGTAAAPAHDPAQAHTPLPLARLLALATQKFVADVAADAYQYSRMRSGTLTSNSLSAAAAAAAAGSQSTAAGGGAGGSGAPPGGVGAAAASQAAGGKGGAGAHVLGMPRAGFGGGGQGGGQGRAVLTMEDLGMAVGEYGVNVRRGEFYR